MLFLWAAASWILLAVLAIINAGVREKVFTRHLSELRSHQLSSITFTLVVFVIAAALQRIVHEDVQTMLVVGIGWGCATLAFELFAGHYVFKNPWEKLFADYNVLKGRIWVLVLLSTFLAPPLVAL